MSRLFLPCIASLAVGAGIGWTLHGADGAAPPILSAPAAAQNVSTARVSSYVASGIDVAQLRAVLREELAAVRANAPQDSGRSNEIKEPAASPELTAQRQAAADEIETMIRSGEWGNEQRLRFQERMAFLDPEQGARLLRDVTIALNNGTLHVTTSGPPL